MFVVGLFIVPSAEFIFFASDSLICAASIVQKCLIYFLYFPNFPILKENPKWKISKQKRNPFIISVTLTLSSPSTSPPPPPPPGAFLLLVVVRHFSHFLCLSWFLSVWKYPHSAIILQLTTPENTITYHDCPRRDFAQKAKSRAGGTPVTRAYIKESTYSWNIQSVYSKIASICLNRGREESVGWWRFYCLRPQVRNG